jgi:hypothetical protein
MKSAAPKPGRAVVRAAPTARRVRRSSRRCLGGKPAASMNAKAFREPRPTNSLNSSNSSILLVLVQELGKIVMIIGIVLAIGGVLLWKFPGWFGWMGRLPGDISVQKGNFSFYFPVVTCIVISVVLTLLGWLFRR